MSVQTTCPSCQKTYAVPDALLGKKAVCKSCGKSFVVGDGANEPPLPATSESANVMETKGVLFARLAEPEADTPLERAGHVAQTRRRQDRDEDEGSDNSSMVLVLALVAGGAVLMLLVLGLGGWFLLRGVPQAGPVEIEEARVEVVPRPPVVDQRPMQPAVPAPAVLGPVPLLMAPVNWQAVPDPPAQPFQMAAAPAGKVPLPPGHQILFPTTLSPFVAVGKNFVATDTRQLLDFRTMKAAGSIPGKLGLFHLAVSPDGLYLAGVDRLKRNTIEVYSFKTGQVAHRLTTPSPVDWLDFAASNRLVVVRNAQQKTVEVWDLAKGNRLAARSSPGLIFRMALAVSPGQRYVALFTPVKIDLFDLVQLREAGEIQVPLPEQGGLFQCLGMAFSPDGAELAALFGEGDGFRLRSWEMDKGSARVNHRLPDAAVRQALAKAGAGAVVPLMWWPERKGWLVFGTSLIHYQTGAEVASLPPSPGLGGSRCLLPGDLQAAVSGPDAARFLEVTPLPVR